MGGGRGGFKYFFVAFLDSSCIAVDVLAGGLACGSHLVGMLDEIVDQGGERCCIGEFEGAFALEQGLCFLELLVVRTEYDGDSIYGGFGDIMDAGSESSANEGELSVTIDGREFAEAVDDEDFCIAKYAVVDSLLSVFSGDFGVEDDLASC